MPPPALNNSGTTDRFSLLLLEPGEIYFKDVAVTYCSDPDASGKAARDVKLIRGRLKICSKSVVFVPQQSSDPSLPDASPLVKFPLADCPCVQEWLPRSFQSFLAKETSVLSILARSQVLMLSDNKVAPFKFSKVEPLTPFVFSLKYAKLDHCLPLMCQLQRAATLPPVEQNGMIAAIVYSTQNRSDFDNCWLESIDERILLKTVGNKITPLVVNPGKIVLTSTTLYFQPYNNAEEKPVIKVKLASIKRIFQRRYLLRPLGLEIEFLNAKAKSDQVYLTFVKPEERKKLYHKLTIARQQLEMKPEPEPEHPLSSTSFRRASHTSSADCTIVPAPCTDMCEENMMLQWQNGIIGNFEYLLYLNSAADRSFNDLTQYPVVPWVIVDYTSRILDLDDPATFRDFSKPMGALNEDRLEALKERSQDIPEPRFLYGSHYSTPGFVLYFLARKIPECMLCLQNGRFDHPDRMFNSVPQTWINVTTHPSDFKELIPEFYMPEYKGDFLLNSRNIDFGVRHCGSAVGDVLLPPWASSPEDFVTKLSEAMEADYVSRNLHKWIDLIFGCKQRGKPAELADNVFYHLCYEGSVDLDKIKDLEARYALELQIGEFGQVPKQLFTSPHPQRMTPSSSSSPRRSSPRKRHLAKALSLIGASDDEDEGAVATPQTMAWRNLKGLRMVCDYKAHRERLSTVAISADKLWIFSASHDNTLKMYSLEEMSLLRSISIGIGIGRDGGKMSISCCFPLPNNQTVLLGSLDSAVCSYSIEQARSYEFDGAHGDAVSCMDWRNGVLATGSWDGTVKIWHCTEVSGHRISDDPECFVAALQHSSPVSAVAICPDGSRQLTAGTRDGEVVLWCLKTASVIQQLPSHSRQVNGVKFGPDARRVVSCGSDFFMKVIDLKTGSILFSKDLGEELTCLAFDGRTVVVGSASGHLNIWDIHEVKFCGRVAAHKGPLTALWVSDDGEVVATGGEDRRVVVWTTKPLMATSDGDA